VDSYHAIANVLARYTHLVDAGDFEGVGAHLAHCTLSSGATGREWTGSSAIAEMYHGAVIVDERGSPRTKHLTTNVVIEIDEAAGAAEAQSSFVVLQARSSSVAVICAGRYDDRLRRIDGTWHLVRRHMEMDLEGDLSQHLVGR
jgi:3-phenylpropionate/cinnamic acid dioxygenase small subunit